MADGVGSLYDFEQTSGKVRWKREAEHGWPSDLVRLGSTLYAGLLLRVHELLRGREMELQTGARNPGFEFPPAPTSDGERVFFAGLDGRLFAFDARSGGADLLPQLYLHGLSQGDFELALRGLLGEGAPLTPSAIERLRAKWVTEYDAWRQRSLKGLVPVYL